MKMDSGTPTRWRRSSRCADCSCVEVARYDGVVLVRDSKQPGVPALAFTEQEWTDFVAGVMAGEF
ncbi:DUF397 domain-containing protein [Nucisporomicrobium flavum]|jgi:Domain of unknown function (DUF397)|uniref:DUF397 domain-containing protein n=1 Tax=Nucisporomicrobium flavum TaxID=2785915 RepID=UPI0018F2DC6D|nr:DUF397 domain-containing protein [Nucisporomicrobium flavum]